MALGLIPYGFYSVTNKLYPREGHVHPLPLEGDLSESPLNPVVSQSGGEFKL